MSPDSVAYDESGVPHATWDAGDILSLVVGCGDFQFAHRDIWESIKGYEEWLGGRYYNDSNVMKKASLLHRTEKAHEDVFHLDHTSSGGVRVVPEGEILPLNDRLAAVNDFTHTQNKEDWGWKNYSLKNYPY